MKAALACAALPALGACATVSPEVTPAPAAGAPTIAISVGPCFGFCPVYDVKVAADGAVAFTGTRHTAVLGTRERRVTPHVYRALAADLAPFRPADGSTAAVPCAVTISDMPTYTITWTGPAGQQTVATHRGGCREGEGRDLDIVLRALPQRLGIEEWMRQTTRPGVSRG
ncbi:DUF6438 domain-containing protein [Sphingomonas sp. H39-1-10]|uniref:DUF6438 domain-containing protein n=1 Tax=Sphingomonas TaxID=13687 RepID=UPI00088E653A|nr:MULTISPECIES: DUF6438 domain-containing protein [Sphingomonas]MDF0488547.1 DUF6438 domain-containing protein [Sphingomonas pollutisoli]SDA11800.1 hypothetical protein SAMN03159340_00187 [Sphingomonas sp. NFR15]